MYNVEARMRGGNRDRESFPGKGLETDALGAAKRSVVAS